MIVKNIINDFVVIFNVKLYLEDFVNDIVIK